MALETKNILKERPFTDEESDELLIIMMDADCKVLFEANKRNHVGAWNFVQQKLAEKGINKTVEKIKNRFSNLKNKYLAVKRELSSGSAAPTWRYFQQFQKYMGERPIASPIVIGDSLAEDDETGNFSEFLANINSNNDIEVNSVSAIIDDSLEGSSSSTSNKRKRKFDKNNEPVELLREKFEYDKARQEKLDKENEDREDKLINVLKNFTDTFTSALRNHED